VLMKITVYNVNLCIIYHPMPPMLSAVYAQPQFHIVIFVMSLPNVYNVHPAFSYLPHNNNVNSVTNTFNTVFTVKINRHVSFVILNILSKTESVKNVHPIYQDATHVQIQPIVQHVKMVMHTTPIQQAVKL